MISKTVKGGNTVVDATCGNGRDTVFLAGLVGPSGRVFAFDVQERAIEAARTRLAQAGLEGHVTLICDGHQNMDKYVQGPVDAVMFNLGYLPGGEHAVGTRGETTAQALEKAMQLLKVNGVITVVIYYGGDSGFDEKDFISEYITHIDNRQYSVMKSEFVNQINCPPILVCIEKLF